MTTRSRLRALACVVACLLALLAFLASCSDGTSAPPREVPPSYERARQMPGHTAHLGKATAIDGVPRVMVCDDCHDLASKGFDSPGSKPCAKCHAMEDTRHHVGSSALPTTCLSCHAFTRSEGASGTTPTCAGCHAALAKVAPPSPGKPSHASHVSEQATCTGCHAPHAEQPLATVDCRKCHESIDAQHGGSKLCTTCHEPHASAKDAVRGCAGCHVLPTSNSILPSKSLMAPKVVPSGAKVASHEACVTCHAPHAATKKDVASCAGCHADHQGTTTASGKGHTQCTSCHAPHAPASASASCAGCHLGHQGMGAPEIEAHAACTTCHDVHEPKKPAVAACVSCHAGVHPKHPSVTKGGVLSATAPACIGCHEPHPPPATTFTIARSCTTCHATIDAKPATKDSSLHAKGKVVCTQCHQSHEFTLEQPSPSFCARCHSKVEKQVAPGHARCDGCHGEAHAPAVNVACGTCHAKEKATAPKGHEACASCHASHSGALLVGAITKPTALAVTAAFCTSCHASKKKDQHTAVPGGCANCHRPHGPVGTATPPACTTCHVAASLPGLHLTAAHAAKCESCHASHKAPSATRETCTSSCHASQKTHQPDANTCQGCHLFGK